MALNIFSASFISRSPNSKNQRQTGQSSIAHAAYCRRETLTNEKTGTVYDGLKMGRGQKAEWADIYIPKHAPEWMRDPKRLWNELEKKEDQSKRRDTALLNRSWIMTFPKELNREQRIWMAKDFMRMATRDGWVIDGAIHGPDKDNSNWHMHANLPMRDITSEGFGKRRRLGNSAKERNAELALWKDRWADLGARQLERSGFDNEAQEFRYGHLKLHDQRQKAYDRHDYDLFDKLDRLPQIHVGPAANGMEQKGKESYLGSKNKAIVAENERRAKELKTDYKLIKASYEKSSNPEQFPLRLSHSGFVLARVTRQDKFMDDRARIREIFAAEGEYVTVSRTGRVYHLTPNSTGDSRVDIARFLKPLDKMLVLSVSQAKDIQQVGKEYWQELRTGRVVTDIGNSAASLARAVHKTPVKSIGKVVGTVADGMASLFAPPITPERQLEADIARIRREFEAELTQGRTAGRER